MIQATYKGEIEYNNTKGIVFRLTFSGNYGVQTVGDLMNLAPYELSGNPGGVVDPSGSYNLILTSPPGIDPAPMNRNIGGYDVQVVPNANPTLFNFGLTVYLGGVELNTQQAYPAALLNGYVDLMLLVPALGQ